MASRADIRGRDIEENCGWGPSYQGLWLSPDNSIGDSGPEKARKFKCPVSYHGDHRHRPNEERSPSPRLSVCHPGAIASSQACESVALAQLEAAGDTWQHAQRFSFHGLPAESSEL